MPTGQEEVMGNIVEKLFLDYYSAIVQMVIWVFSFWVSMVKPLPKNESMLCMPAYVFVGIIATGLGVGLPIVSKAIADFSDLITGKSSDDSIKMPLLINAIVAVVMWGASTAVYYYW